jgi:hypothetical protein
MATKKVTHDIILARDKKTYGEELATKWVDDKVTSLLSADVLYAHADSNKYK